MPHLDGAGRHRQFIAPRHLAVLFVDRRVGLRGGVEHHRPLRLGHHGRHREDLVLRCAVEHQEEVVVDDGLVTSRKPDDIPAFNSALGDALEHGSAGDAAE